MRRSTPALLLASLACAWGAVVACSKDDSSGGNDVVVNDLGQCTAGGDASAGKFPHSALPTGQPCTASTSCHMPIDDCDSDWSESPVGDNLQEYVCTCTSGAWSCVDEVRVDNECGAVSDAGVDASPDANPDASSDGAIDALGDSPADVADAPFDAPFDAEDGALLDANIDAPDAL